MINNFDPNNFLSPEIRKLINMQYESVKPIIDMRKSIPTFPTQLEKVIDGYNTVAPTLNIISSQNALLGKSLSNAINAKSYLDMRKELDNSLSLLDEQESEQIFDRMDKIIESSNDDFSDKNDEIVPTKNDISGINKSNNISSTLNQIKKSDNQTNVVKKPTQTNKQLVNEHKFSLNQQQINNIIFSGADIITGPTLGYIYRNDPFQLLYTEIIANALIFILICLNSAKE